MFRLRGDRFLNLSLRTFAFVSGSIVVGIVGFLVMEAWPVFSTGKILAFFTDQKWQPGSVRDPQFGILPMLIASVLVTVLAAVIAMPLGIFGAIFQVFFAPTFWSNWQGRFLELLAGVPSIIFGFWGLTVIVPLINRIHPPGQSLLAAGIVLALMILPTIALTSRTALDAVDTSLIRGAAALGISRPTLIFSIALPNARGGILSGCVLGITRAIGETMAVVMVCGNIAKIPHSVFDPVRPVTSTIALEMGYATADHNALLYAAGLVLVLITGLLLIVQNRKVAQ